MKKFKAYALFLLLVLLVGGAVYFNFFYIKPEEALQNFKEITYREPLLVSPELNDKEYKDSTNKLVESQRELLDLLDLQDEATPTGFLKSLIDVKESDNNFRAEPSYENAEKLLASYRKSVEIYQTEVIRAKDNLEKYFPYDTEKSFVNFGSTTNNKIISDDLSLLIKNGEALEREIDKRERILGGKIGYKPRSVEPRYYEQLSLKENLGDLGKYRNQDSSLEKLYIVDSPCFGNEEEENIFTYYTRKSINGKDIFLPKIANNKYYQKLSETIPYENRFIEEGIEWRLIKEGNTYRCNNLEYQANLLALINFNKKYESKPFFTDDNLVKLDLSGHEITLWQQGAVYEGRILEKRDYYFYKELVTLAEYYQYFSTRYDLGSVEFKELSERFLFINNQQYGLDLILNTEFFYNDLRDRLGAGVILVRDSFANHLYATRINYSFVFLNFSDAVWRLDEKPKYTTTHQKNDRFLTIAELSKLFSAEEIERIETITHADTLGL
jgi:hypothetical protein